MVPLLVKYSITLLPLESIRCSISSILLVVFSISGVCCFFCPLDFFIQVLTVYFQAPDFCFQGFILFIVFPFHGLIFLIQFGDYILSSTWPSMLSTVYFWLCFAVDLFCLLPVPWFCFWGSFLWFRLMSLCGLFSLFLQDFLPAFSTIHAFFVKRGLQYRFNSLRPSDTYMRQ